MLKETLYSHMMSREAEVETEEASGSQPEGPSTAPDETRLPEGPENGVPQSPSVHTGNSDSTEPDGTTVL